MMPESFRQLLLQINIDSLHGWSGLLLSLTCLMVLGYLCYFVAKGFIKPAVHGVLTHFKPVLVEAIEKPLGQMTDRLGLLAPLVFWLSSFSWFVEPELVLFTLINKVFLVYLYINVGLFLTACMDIGTVIYHQQSYAKDVPIKGIIQIVKLAMFVFFSVLIIAELLDKTPLYLLSGLGALTAVLLIVFKDTILGLVAGIQIATHRLLAHGDWIEMPKYGADGTVLEVGLHTVKVRNFDNTITTIPTYRLISDSFKNWRGMSESDGRRIKRAMHIDAHSIAFIDQQQRQQLFDKFNGSLITGAVSDEDWQHAQTNMGLFRCYCELYLRQHPQINQQLSLMARQLQPTAYGVPIEIYCFCLDKRWVPFEHVQAELIEHLLASLPLFGLRVFQRPGGTA